jgi:hypothetical protein
MLNAAMLSVAMLSVVAPYRIAGSMLSDKFEVTLARMFRLGWVG